MTFTRRHGGTLMVLGMITAAGCGTEEPNAPSGPGVQLEDAFSKTGSLVVEMGEDGQISVSVQGRIGTDSQAMAQAALLKPTLVDTYMALHPDAVAVPEQVTALSKKLATLRKLSLASGAPPDSLSVGPAVSVAKDANAFYANACVSTGPGFAGYTADYCLFQPGFHAVCTLYQINRFDLSNAWNESPYTAKHSLSGNSAVLTLPPYWWKSTEWYGVYSNRRSCLIVDGPESNVGSLGITHERYFTDNVGQPG